MITCNQFIAWYIYMGRIRVIYTHVLRVEEVVEDKVVGEEAATVMEKVEMEEGEEVKVKEQVAVEAALVMEVNESESWNIRS